MPFVLFTPLLMTGLSYNGATASILFGNPVVHWLGVISYSLYLLHPLCLGIAGHLMDAMQSRGIDVPQGLFMILGIVMTLAAVRHAEFEG